MNFNSLLHTLQTQASAVMHTVAAVMANDPQPARTTLIYTIVPILIVLVLAKISKKMKK